MSAADIHHDPWLIPVGDGLVALSDEIFMETERACPRPQRQRKDAAERRQAITANLIANLAGLALKWPVGSRLAISLKNTALTRYDRQDFPREVVRLTVERLEALGLVVRFMGLRGRERTAIAPSSALLARLQEIHEGDIGRLPGAESIILRVSNGRDRTKGLAIYADTPETVTMRQDMEAINAALAGADIRLAGERREDCQLVRIFQIEEGEPHHFGNYGRLYRGFWQPLKRTERHLLAINGDEVVDLDYRSMFLSLAYLRQGVAVPEGDPYLVPGLEGHREGVKKAISALFSRHGPISRLSDELRELLPAGWTGRRLMAAITLAHPAIAPLLGTNIGPRFTRKESDIMVAVLLRLIYQGIIALACHDGLLVGKRFRADAIAVMTEVSAKMLGTPLAVEEKPLARPKA